MLNPFSPLKRNAATKPTVSNVIMASCVQCHRQIDEAYAFCPMCGADNRPPERREPVTYCNHQFVSGMPCCVLCGAGYDEPIGSTPATRHKATVTIFLLGVGLAALLAYLLAGEHSATLPGHSFIQALFGYRYSTYDRSYGYHYYWRTTNLGYEIAWGLGGFAVLCFVQAFLLQRKFGSMDASDVADWTWWQFIWFW